MVGMVGLAPTKAVRPRHLQCLAIATMRHPRNYYNKSLIASICDFVN